MADGLGVVMASRRRSTRRRRREPVRRPPPLVASTDDTVEQAPKQLPDPEVAAGVLRLRHLRVDLWWSVGLMGTLVAVLVAVWVSLP